ncbi:DinB family protein [Ornithinibacillus californiensis]|uniref:DinB family protein n=1 Tax=Ornithinibacillus californiensis TaxID=161536 RepID=UPI00064DBFB4|nr:DinB family protein [Ornithinibacillus californiensis]
MNRRHEVLFTQLETYRNETLQLIEHISKEEAEIVPEGFNNNIRWNLGHMYLDQYLWIEAVTREKSNVTKTFTQWFGFGTSPINFTDDTPELEELKQLLQTQIRNIKEKYGDRLEEEFPPTEMGMHTIEQVLTRTIYHEGLHAAAIQYLKRFVERLDIQ